MDESAGWQATLQLPEEFPAPNGAQSRIVSVNESEKHGGSVKETQYSFSCVGWLAFHSKLHSVDEREMYTVACFRTTAWLAG